MNTQVQEKRITDVLHFAAMCKGALKEMPIPFWIKRTNGQYYYRNKAYLSNPNLEGKEVNEYPYIYDGEQCIAGYALPTIESK